MTIQYFINREISLEDITSVYKRSGIDRPYDDHKRMKLMLKHTNLIVSAWKDELIVGIARCFVDYAWVCYLSDLAVDQNFQKQGIGKQLIESVKEAIKPHCQLVLLSAPDALEYYSKNGFKKASHAFIIERKEN